MGKKVNNKRQEHNVTFEPDIKTEQWARIEWMVQGKTRDKKKWHIPTQRVL